ncbi:chemotaxis protein CheD [Gorillibacterium sp. sgz5001074]|uniref:chemotaxis protein CheD n=1 Tax=Gorillibacterium sp. sgz5001074 TaxID=3446695 RepID=UPI003F66B01B
MTNHVVGIGGWAVSSRPGDRISTYALASCIAVTAYLPDRGWAGMVHLALPSPLVPEDADERPAYFAETGVPFLIDRICGLAGCSPRELALGLYGGAESVREKDWFRIGQRNIEAVRRALQPYGLWAGVQELGGRISRSLVMEVGTGAVSVRTQPIRI